MSKSKAAPATPRLQRLLALATLSASALAVSSALAATPAPIPVSPVSEVPVEVTMHFTGPGNVSQNNLLYTVPAGKMLIIDSVTLVHGASASPQSLRGLLVIRDTAGNVASLLAVSAVPGSLPTAATTQQMHTHVMPGNVVLANVTTAGGPGVDAFVSMSGHLQTAP